ncbi:MAG: LemA family protein [Deltaproteobacteria bacterium]|nr:LemA family protein [Deltaproteobacteria bacterium]MCB9489664.1 LemA family protein [Deltaproteobacteria bacterium]
MAALIVIGVLALVFVGAVVGIYNGLVSARNQYKNAFAQIDVQLKRRHDLIPNLVETAKGYLKHERETLEAVIAARSGAVDASKRAADNPGDPNAMQNLTQAEGVLTGALGRLFALSENYPDLKANTTMNQLMEELTSTENKISFARQFFNDAVTSYKVMREKFPNNIIAGMFNFADAQLLEPIESPQERRAPQVSFT